MALAPTLRLPSFPASSPAEAKVAPLVTPVPPEVIPESAGPGEGLNPTPELAKIAAPPTPVRDPNSGQFVPDHLNPYRVQAQKNLEQYQQNAPRNPFAEMGRVLAQLRLDNHHPFPNQWEVARFTKALIGGKQLTHMHNSTQFAKTGKHEDQLTEADDQINSSAHGKNAQLIASLIKSKVLNIDAVPRPLISVLREGKSQDNQTTFLSPYFQMCITSGMNPHFQALLLAEINAFVDAPEPPVTDKALPSYRQFQEKWRLCNGVLTPEFWVYLVATMDWYRKMMDNVWQKLTVQLDKGEFVPESPEFLNYLFTILEQNSNTAWVMQEWNDNSADSGNPFYNTRRKVSLLRKQIIDWWELNYELIHSELLKGVERRLQAEV